MTGLKVLRSISSSRVFFPFSVVLLLLVWLPEPASAFPRDKADQIIADVEGLMRGSGSVGELEMTVQTPRWKRVMRMKFWEKVPGKMLVKVMAPTQDQGVGSLKVGKDLWSYNPHIDQVQKIPPSLMMDSWMGSDFTNDDITRESSIKEDYEVVGLTEGSIEGKATWRVELQPKPTSPVVWDKVVVEVEQEGHRPRVQEYYDEAGKVARTMRFSDYKKANDGRMFPHVWRMENLQEAGRYTEVKVLSMEFRSDLEDSVFSMRNLKRGRL